MELTDEQLQKLVDMVASKLLENHHKIAAASLEMKTTNSHENLDHQPIDQLTHADYLVADISHGSVYINAPHNCSMTVNNSNHIHDQDTELEDDYQLKLSSNDNHLLETLSKEKNITKIEIIRKALALINIIIQAEKKGNKIAIVNNEEIVSEITGL